MRYTHYERLGPEMPKKDQKAAVFDHSSNLIFKVSLVYRPRSSLTSGEIVADHETFVSSTINVVSRYVTKLARISQYCQKLIILTSIYSFLYLFLFF